MQTPAPGPSPHLISVVIPVYGGQHTLDAVVDELAASATDRVSPQGRHYRVTEAVLVHDCGPDESDQYLGSPTEMCVS